VHFELLGPIAQIKTSAVGSRIREIGRLRKFYGRGRWRKRKGIAKVRLSDGSVHLAEIHWYEATGIGRKEYKPKQLVEVVTMRKPKRAAPRFLICADNKGYTVSLEKRKIYVALPDATALKHGQVRVIDESGKGYLYPKSLFLPITVPQAFRKAILKAA